MPPSSSFSLPHWRRLRRDGSGSKTDVWSAVTVLPAFAARSNLCSRRLCRKNLPNLERTRFIIAFCCRLGHEAEVSRGRRMYHRGCPGLALVAAIVFAVFFGLSPIAAAEDLPVDLELVLAVDISLSMDEDEQRLQRDGYAAAFRHPEIIEAIRSGPHGRIAATYVEWAGENFQRTVVPWTLIDGPSTAIPFADKLAAAPIEQTYRTSI